MKLNIGVDAGLLPGMRLDVYRETNGGQYLGTAVIIGSQLHPKTAVGEFRPARGVPIAKLRADELPRKGDMVGLIALPTGRAVSLPVTVAPPPRPVER